jgi:sugar lactone lactonase YvrE
VRKVTGAGYISTVAGTGSCGFIGDGTQATKANLYNPTQTAVASTGNIYIADSFNHRVRLVTAGTGIITTVAGTGFYAYDGEGLVATSSSLSYPSGIALDVSGNLYIGDYDNQRVRLVTYATGIMTTLVSVNAPQGLALDSSGNMYIATDFYNKVYKYTVSSSSLTIVAGTGGGASSTGDGGLATSSTINRPRGVAVDTLGNIYITESTGNRLRKVTVSTGVITSLVVGDETCQYTGDGGLAYSADLCRPWGVALDKSGNIYIADTFNNRIRTFAQNYAPSGAPSMIPSTG